MKRVSKTNKFEKKIKVVKNQPLKKEKKDVANGIVLQYIEQYPFLIFTSLLLLVGLVVFKDFIFAKKLYLFKDIGSDTINTFFPTYVLRSETTAEGLQYTFRSGMGAATLGGDVPFITKVIRFLVNPFDFILFRLDSETLAYAIGPLQVLKIMTAGVVFYFYLQTLSISKYVSIIGALFFAFSGFMIGGSGWHQHTYQLLYFALLLFGFEQALRKKRYLGFLLVLIFTFKALNVFYLYLFGTFLFIYAIFRIIEHYQSIKEALVFVGLSAGMTFIAFLLNFPSISASIEVILNQPRVSGNLSKAEQMQSISVFATGDFLHNVTAVLRLFSNDILGTGKMSEVFANGNRYLTSDYKGYYNYYEAPMFYIGLLTLLIFPQVIWSGNKKQKVIYSMFLVAWVLPVVFPYFRRAYFLFFGDYYRVFSIFLPFTLLFLAVKGLDKIFTNQKLNVYLLAGTFLFLLIALNYNYYNQERLAEFNLQDSPVNSGIKGFATVLLIIYFLLLLAYQYKREYKTQVLIILIGLIVIEVTYLSNITVNERDHVSAREFRSKKGYNDYTVDAVAYINEQDKSFYRIEKDYSSGLAVHGSLNDAKVQGYFGTSSYASNQNRNYIRFMQQAEVIPLGDETAARWSTGVKNRPLLSVFANVKYMLSKSENPFFKQFGYSLLHKTGDVFIFKNDYHLPLGYTYNQYLKESDFKTLSTLQKDIAFVKSVIVPDSMENMASALKKYNLSDTIPGYSVERLKADTDSLKQDTLTITSFKEDHITGKINISKPELLFFSILYDKNWKLKINGEEKHSLRVNWGFTGVLLDKGEYDVELRYEKQIRSSQFLIVDIISLLLVLIISGLYIFRKKFNYPFKISS